MTVCYIGKSVNLVTQQFCRKTSMSSKYGNVSGSWSSIQRSASLFRVTNKTKPVNVPTSFMVVSWTLQPTTYRNQSTSSLAIMDQRLHISRTLLNTLVCTSTASFRGITTLTPALCGSWTEILHIAFVTSRNVVITHTLDRNYTVVQKKPANFGGL